jgi:hypothetical protein
MSVTKVFHHGRVIFQTPGVDEIPEQAIVAHVDATGLLVLEQDRNSIVIQAGTLDELVKVLRTIRQESQAKR